MFGPVEHLEGCIYYIPVLEELMHTAYIQPHYTVYMHAHTWDGA